MAIDTIQHPGVTDYRVRYHRTNNKGIWTWTRQLAEVSANDETRVIEQQKNYTSFYNQGGKPYILFSFDLAKINFPQQYRVAFDIVDKFVIKHHFCRLVDGLVITNGKFLNCRLQRIQITSFYDLDILKTTIQKHVLDNSCSKSSMLFLNCLLSVGIINFHLFLALSQSI